METTPVPEPPQSNEIARVGEKLTQLVDPVNMAKTRLDTLYDDKLNATRWGYWRTPNFEVQSQNDPDHPYEVSYNLSDTQGSTRKMVSVKHNGNEAWFSFPNRFGWINRTQAEMDAMENGTMKEEVAELVEAMKGIQDRESAHDALIQVTASPIYGTPDGPDIKRDFRLTYQVSPNGVRPLLPEGAMGVPANTAQELNRMTDALSASARSAMRDKVELVKDTTMETPVVPPIKVSANF